MNKLFNTIIICFFSIFVLVFGIRNYLRANNDIFLLFIVFYFIMVFSSIVFMNIYKNYLLKIKMGFPSIWRLFLILEIVYFIVMICLKLFYKDTTNTGIYHADIFILILLSQIAGCHYGWYFFRKLS